jgi:gamma-glutamyltranspeptidase/glutathione hydrolase
LTLEYARQRGLKDHIPLDDLNAVTVPGLSSAFRPEISATTDILTGAAAAWIDTVKEFGSGKVTLAEILDPAIRMAEEGCVFRAFRTIIH